MKEIQEIAIISPISGDVYAMEIDVDLEVFLNWRKAFKGRVPNTPHLQDAFPDLTNGEREFLFSGISPIEWKLTELNDRFMERGKPLIQNIFEMGDEDRLLEMYDIDFKKCWKVRDHFVE